MSEAVREAIFAEPVLLSQPFQVGEFVARHFYHPLFGFGTLQADCLLAIPSLPMTQDEHATTTNWDSLGTFGRRVISATIYYEEESAEDVSKKILDDALAKDEICEMAYGNIEDPWENMTRDVRVFSDDEEVDPHDLFLD